MSGYETLLEKIRSCTLCTLSEKRTQAVPGEGSLDADIMFIGEGPGFYEDRDGRPFVGPAGQLLEQLLASIGLDRQEVYISNMLKCRPPNNRDPLPGEVKACKPYLDEQIELIAPKIIVALGRHSFGKFFPDESISKARGKPRTWNGTIVYPMYHPAAALRNPRLRTSLEDDFRSLTTLLEDSPAEYQEPKEESTEQLSLF
jgi:DNA polymerase